MVGYTLHQIGKIFHDIKNSWYFRVWGILWISSAVIVASILITLAHSSTNLFAQKDVMVWVENTTTIQFPRFSFRVGWGSTQLQIVSLTCTHDLFPVNVSPCPNESVTSCRTIYADAFFTSQSVANVVFGDERIICSMTTVGNSSVLGNLIAFDNDGSNEESVGPNAYASIWIAPNQNAWVMLEKSIFTYSNGNNITDWDRNLLYHSTVSTTGQYNISVIIGSYNVWHIDQTDIYNGMMAMGDIGGFAFFMLIIHSVIMLFVGLCLFNNSTFLKNANSGESVNQSEYSAVKH